MTKQKRRDAKYIAEVTKEDQCSRCSHGVLQRGPSRGDMVTQARRGYPWRCRRTDTQGTPGACEWLTEDPVVALLYTRLDMLHEQGF